MMNKKIAKKRKKIIKFRKQNGTKFYVWGYYVYLQIWYKFYTR